MRCRPGLALAFASVTLLAFEMPVAAKPVARTHVQRQHVQRQHVRQQHVQQHRRVDEVGHTRAPTRKRPATSTPQRPVAQPTRTALETARGLWRSARAQAVPALVAEARKYIDTNPTERKRLWCATFMNFVLAKLGYEGTNSDAAKSFAEYGRRISEPRVGAIAVLTRGKRGGHVGVVSGIDPHGNPIIISGNHTPRGVGEGVYARSRVIAYVVPTERRTAARVPPRAAQEVESPFAALAAAIRAGEPRERARAPQPARPQAAPAPPHRIVQQTPDQRAESGIGDPLSELMGSFERTPAPQRRVM
jgi:uncharacterized protein (TIGR02594 family)